MCFWAYVVYLATVMDFFRILLLQRKTFGNNILFIGKQRFFKANTTIHVLERNSSFVEVTPVDHCLRLNW